MNYLVDLYIKKPDDVRNLFKQKVNISVKVDGSAFQISYDEATDKVEYHKRGGSSGKLGPVIDDYTKMFARQLNDAIMFFSKENKSAWKEIKRNKFLAIELLDDGDWVLLNAIGLDGKVYNAGDELEKKASNLSIFSVPLLYDGILTDNLKQVLLDMCTLSEDTTNDQFKTMVIDAFNMKTTSNSWGELLRNSEMEGIVLTWEIDGKIVQYKIINPAFKKRHEAEQAAAKEKAEQNRDKLNELLKFLLDNFEKKAEKLSSNWLKNLELNFLNMTSDETFTKELLKLSSKVTPNESKFFFLQIDKVPKDIKALIGKHGTPMTTAYEQFIMTFNKERKRNYIIDKEFQQRINNLIKSIQESMMPLKQYIIEHNRVDS